LGENGQKGGSAGTGRGSVARGDGIRKWLDGLGELGRGDGGEEPNNSLVEAGGAGACTGGTRSEWEADLAEREVCRLAGQFPQATAELVESWVGLESGERQRTEQGKEVTTPAEEAGRGRPPIEADRLLQEEEEKERKLKDWRTEEEVVLKQEEGEDSERPSPRIKEEWLSKKDNPWDTKDKEWLRAQLEAPMKEQIAGRCAQEGHWQVWEETCGGVEFMKSTMPMRQCLLVQGAVRGFLPGL
jgi:hypothetical protein